MNSETRRERLRQLMSTRFRGSQDLLAKRCGISPGRVSQLLNPAETFGERSARRIEAKLGLPPNWLDAQSSPPAAALPPALDLGLALEALGIELARDLPDDVRQDVADQLHKLAMRRGAERDQQQVLALLSGPQSKQRPTGT